MRRLLSPASRLACLLVAASFCFSAHAQQKNEKHRVVHAKKHKKHKHHVTVITHGSDDDKKLKEIKAEKEKGKK